MTNLVQPIRLRAYLVLFQFATCALTASLKDLGVLPPSPLSSKDCRRAYIADVPECSEADIKTGCSRQCTKGISINFDEFSYQCTLGPLGDAFLRSLRPVALDEICINGFVDDAAIPASSSPPSPTPAIPASSSSPSATPAIPASSRSPSPTPAIPASSSSPSPTPAKSSIESAAPPEATLIPQPGQSPTPQQPPNPPAAGLPPKSPIPSSAEMPPPIASSPQTTRLPLSASSPFPSPFPSPTSVSGPPLPVNTPTKVSFSVSPAITAPSTAMPSPNTPPSSVVILNSTSGLSKSVLAPLSSTSASSSELPVVATTASVPVSAASAMASMSPNGGISAQQTKGQLAAVVGGVLGACAAFAIFACLLFYFSLRTIRRRRMERIPSYSSWGQLDPEMTPRSSLPPRFSNINRYIPRSPLRTAQAIPDPRDRLYQNRNTTLQPVDTDSTDHLRSELDRLQGRPRVVRQPTVFRPVRNPETAMEHGIGRAHTTYEMPISSSRPLPRDNAGFGPWV